MSSRARSERSARTWVAHGVLALVCGFVHGTVRAQDAAAPVQAEAAPGPGGPAQVPASPTPTLQAPPASEAVDEATVPSGPAVHDAPAAAEKPFESDAAREAVLRAQARFEDGDYRGAAIEFERAYGMLSAGPRRYAVLNNLAVCYERTFAFDEALATYERYLREAEPTGSDRAEVEQIVRGLRDLLGGLRVTSGAVARVFIDDRERGSIPLEVRLTAGTHVVELRAPGFQTVRRSVRIFPRQQLQLAITLTSEVRFHGAHRSYFWSGVALTAVTAAVGAGFGGRAVRESRRARERAKTDIATVEDEANIRRSTLTADIALGSAALFGVGSLVLGLLTDFRAPRDSVRSSKSSALNVTAAPTPGKSGAMLTFHGAVR